MDPEGFAEVPDRSVGFELECIAEGNPEPRVTWSRGIIILKDNCFCLIQRCCYIYKKIDKYHY